MNGLIKFFSSIFAHNYVPKKLVIPAVFLLFISGIYAQSPMATVQEIGLFKNSITCIVMDNDDVAYNVNIKKAVQDNWESTEFEFIKYDEFEKRRENIKYSFLVLVKGVYDEDPGGVSYDFLSLVMGGGGAQEVINMPQLASVPVAYSDEESSTYGYALPAIVNFIQRHVRVMENKRMRISLFDMKYFNFFRKFKDKALLLPEEKLAPEIETLYKVKDVYPYYVEVMSMEQLEEEVGKESPNTLFLLHVGPIEQKGTGKCFEMVFHTNGELYYYNERDITNENPDGLTKKDLRKMKR